MRVTIDLIEEVHNCIVGRFVFQISSVKEIENLINIDFEEDNTIGYDYDLNYDAVSKIMDNFKISNNALFNSGIIRRNIETDNFSYFVHTGGELCLMLKKLKPFSYFSFFDKDINEYKDIMNKFSPYVSSGDFFNYNFELHVDGLRVRYLTFSLPDESWRGPALELLKKSGLKSGWSAGMERMEGSLLGYSDYENDEYLNFIFKNN